MRPYLLALAALAAVGLILMDRAGELGPYPSTEFYRCVAACERSEPGDRGQGCIDLMCNPLFEDLKEDP